MTFGFIYDSNKKLECAVENEEEYRRMLAENTWIIHGEIFGKNPDKLPEKSQNISRNNAGISQENTPKMSEKVLEKPSKMLVKKAENGQNYDANTLEYCCVTLEKLVVSDGGSIKLTDKGLVLKSNPNYPVFRLKYCPNCGTNIVHDDDSFVEKSAPDVKEIQRDKPK